MVRRAWCCPQWCKCDGSWCSVHHKIEDVAIAAHPKQTDGDCRVAEVMLYLLLNEKVNKVRFGHKGG